jgi:hypothetical protein
VVSKAFKVKIVERNYTNVEYNYRVLTLIPDDDTLNDWNDNLSAEESLEEQADPEPSEESLKSLPQLITERVGETGTNMLRSQNETFKFIKQTSSHMESIFRHDKNDETTDPTKKDSSQFTEDKKILLNNTESTEKLGGAKKADEFYNHYDNEKIGLKVSRANEDDAEDSNFEFDTPDNMTVVENKLNKSGDTDKMLDLQISN